jgi:single-stranded-DNA-specific exonuclease
MKRIWILRKKDNALIESLSKDLNISLLTSHILVNRGMKDIDNSYKFLHPSLSDLYSPFLLSDMDIGTNRILKAIKNKEKVLIYGDYDVDGVTATSMLLLFLNKFSPNVSYYIPDRLKDGYGINIDAIKRFKNEGVKLIISVDCGISDYEEIDYCNNNGMDVIICDHHEPPARIPGAIAVLNPKRKDSTYPFKDLTGVGVVFKLIIGLRARLREKGEDNLPNLKRYMDLAALGTIADIAPIIDENRIIVKFGLTEIADGDRPGIKALKSVSGINGGPVDCGMVGFRLAPRINAAGRLSNANLGVELLTTSDENKAFEIAKTLDSENSKRQNIENKIFKEVLNILEGNRSLLMNKSIVLASENWHAGVIGIVASRVVEEYYRPTILISIADGIGKGSGRSIEKFHMYEGLRSCEHLLEGYGGHKHAAGLKVSIDKISEFQELFEEVAKSKLRDEDLYPVINIDSEIMLRDLTAEIVKEFELLEPFGPSNPEPVIASSNIKISDCKIVGDNHLKVTLKDGNFTWDGIGFDLGRIYPLLYEKADIAFSPRINTWQGLEYLQLRLKDIREGGMK